LVCPDLRWKPHPQWSILPIFPSSARSSTSSPWLLPPLPPSFAILALPLSPDVPQQLLPPLPPHHSPHTNLIHLLHLQSWQWSHLSPSHIARITFTIVKPASFQLTVDGGDGECPFAKRSSRTATGCTSPSLRLHPLVHFTFYQSKDQLSIPRRIYFLHIEGMDFILAQNVAHHWTSSSSYLSAVSSFIRPLPEKKLFSILQYKMLFVVIHDLCSIAELLRAEIWYHTML